MANKMLIDAAHPEETRVVVLRGNRIEEFDFEAANRKQLRGNIYLAKVTRVEPSLQAAFIEYGGNRHGFLAFAEIHPDYYQIPVADRQALLEEEARSHDEDEDEPRPSQERRRSRRHRRGDGQPAQARRAAHTDEAVTGDAVPPHGGSGPADDAGEREGDTAPLSAGAPEGPEPHDDEVHDLGVDTADEEQPTHDAAPDEDVPVVEDVVSIDRPVEDEGTVFAFSGDEPAEDDHAAGEDDAAEGVTVLEGGVEASLAPEGRSPPAEDRDTAPENGHDSENGAEEDVVEQIGGDALEDVPQRVSRPRRHYKIQEVIKRRQVLLVQVVKEERGNKGAALTTYLSLAGRYAVLMPNTARGGGISRKITDAEDRKRLKAIATELDVPDGMGIILRTAGAARGMPEVRRDFEYLMRMWETVRETTLKSTAPTLVYEEGSLIKRSIRDLFNKDVDEVIVSGDEAYREAKDFMRLLMPSQAKAVVHYRDPQPIFAKAGAEAQLDAMFSNQVTLRSGGYLVINQTEALVAIDVNSGRSTREHNIEDTALRTNLEAADEVARQLRLRDLAGLIVVDFIDMEESRNDRAVERRIKDALKDDRARIQIGRISHFGLLEMSRQRMRTGVLEGSTVMCAHCAGTGSVRSMSSIALHVLRLIEDALIKSAESNLVVRTRSEVALYILNQKRMNLLELESRFGVAITLVVDVNMTGALYHAIDRGSEATPPAGLFTRSPASTADEADALDESDDEVLDEAEEEPVRAIVAGASVAEPRSPEHTRDNGSDGEGGRRRKRRRRRRGGRDSQGGYAEREHGAAGSVASEGEDGGEGPESDGFDQEELTDIAAGFAPPEGEPAAQADGDADDGVGNASPETAPAMAEADQTMEPVGDLLDAIPPVVEGAGEAAPSETIEAAVPEGAEAPRPRRSRRSPRVAAEASAPEAAESEPAPAVKRPRRSRARAAEAEPAAAPPAPVEAEATMERAGDSEATAPVVAEPELPLAAAAEPQPSEAVADDRPKRSGWWQRAKASFTS